MISANIETNDQYGLSLTGKLLNDSFHTAFLIHLRRFNSPDDIVANTMKLSAYADIYQMLGINELAKMARLLNNMLHTQSNKIVFADYPVLNYSFHSHNESTVRSIDGFDESGSVPDYNVCPDYRKMPDSLRMDPRDYSYPDGIVVEVSSFQINVLKDEIKRIMSGLNPWVKDNSNTIVDLDYIRGMKEAMSSLLLQDIFTSIERELNIDINYL